MTDFTDAKTSLEASIAANKLYLSTQDQPAKLAATFSDLIKIRKAIEEWVRATVSLAAMDAANEQAFDQEIRAEAVKDLRADAARLVAHAEELRTLIVSFAAKARAA
jgi:protein subunit release factor A